MEGDSLFVVRVREWLKIRVRMWLHLVGCASDSKSGCASDPSPVPMLSYDSYRGICIIVFNMVQRTIGPKGCLFGISNQWKYRAFGDGVVNFWFLMNPRDGPRCGMGSLESQNLPWTFSPMGESSVLYSRWWKACLLHTNRLFSCAYDFNPRVYGCDIVDPHVEKLLEVELKRRFSVLLVVKWS